jgi:dTDP-4-dehydrorhamnose 3,5-epimerase
MKSMIKGVLISPRKVFSDDRGRVMHMMKRTDKEFTRFGEIYFSEVLPGKVKAWQRNRTATVNYACITGNVKLVLYDGTTTEVFKIGESDHCLVTIPPGVWRGFACVGDQKAIVADLTDTPYDPDDIEKKSPDELLDCWK